MTRLFLFIPAALFVGLAAFLLYGLSIDKDVLPSALIDRPAPEFDLPPVSADIPAFSSEDLQGQVSLVNIFGSWCIACRYEHAFLMELQERGDVPIYGIDWKDTPEAGAEWLARFGNPYTAVGNDEKGRTVIDFGVTGAPETFVIDHEGRIRWRFVGPLSEETWERQFRPLIAQLKEEAANAEL